MTSAIPQARWSWFRRRPFWTAGGCAVLLLVVLLAWSRSSDSGQGPPSPPAAGPTVNTLPIGHELTEEFLRQLNDLRLLAGLPLARLDTEASRRCREKALALVLNHASASATQERTLVLLQKPAKALGDALARTNQRLLLLDRQLESIGLGVVHTDTDAWVTVIEACRAVAGQPIVICPADRQQDVPIHFSGGPELSGPVGRQNAGFPITVTLPAKRTITDVRPSLTEGSRAVPFDLIRDKTFPGIGLLPRSPLKPNSTYRVDLALRIDGQPWHRTLTFRTCDDADSNGSLAQKAVDKINSFRRLAGVAPVVLDAGLSHGCRNHARYLVLNADHPAVKGLGAHDEQRNLPGWTPEGEKAGKGVIADGQYEPLAALDAWLATFYHRIPLLDPRLKRVGFGCALGQRHTWVSVVDVASGREPAVTFKTPIVFPIHGQKNVPLCFSGNEVPDPIPEDKDGKAGYPVTITFPEKIAKARASFKDDAGREVPVWFSTPDRPANPRHASHQGTTVCLMAHDPLRPSTTYQVQLSGEVQGRPWSCAWSFTTGAEGTNLEQAAAQVVQRINVHRALAGLPKVALDPVSARNCEAHVRYLLLNSVRLDTKRSNDEDQQLPGFTPEGQAAARSAAVFFRAPEPTVQIDTMMACFQRSYLLDPTLRRIGFGCGLELGRGWICVLDCSSGREETVPVLFPAPDQCDVPTAGLDQAGYPITVSLPRGANDFQASLADDSAKLSDVHLSTLDGGSLLQIVPYKALRPGTKYQVNVSARMNANQIWRQSWQFTTAK